MIQSRPVVVKVVVQSGIVPLDLVGPCQVLESANRLVDSDPRFFGIPPFQVEYIGPCPEIEWWGGLNLSGIAPLPDSLDDTDLLLLPGLYSNESPHPEVVGWLENKALNARTCMAVCSGAIQLALAGLLRERSATTHHSLFEMLKNIDPTIDVKRGSIYVADGNIITSAGISTGIDTLLNWATHVVGNELAIAIARDLVLPLRRSSDFPQLSSWLTGRQHADKAVHLAQNLISMSPERCWTMSLLSERVALGPRQLSRRFRAHTGLTIGEYYRQIRIDRATMLLKETTMPISLIAEALGFGDERHFRRLWQKEKGMSPARWRKRNASLNAQSYL
ncbi:HTH-type transcriptional activator RhaR [Halomonadaceae bacterium LMG 33818]|uniref:GlxA family transcriptional regulator n=1 Tax=Cernens ardua TaxID=3402176 RepID=UPI003EDC0845